MKTITDGNQIKFDYYNYCKTTVDTFPEIKGGIKNTFDILKTQIVTSIRNRRYQKKQALIKFAEPSKKHPLVITSPGSSEISKQSKGLSSKKGVM